jgi:geranylgeranyl diphosphate synthase type I
MNKAVGFIDEGKAALKALPDSEAKTILIGLADYMIARKY